MLRFLKIFSPKNLATELACLTQNTVYAKMGHIIGILLVDAIIIGVEEKRLFVPKIAIRTLANVNVHSGSIIKAKMKYFPNIFHELK
jgi:hypothetical protein